MGWTLVTGMFVVGWWIPEFAAAIAKHAVPVIANFYMGAGFALIGAWIAYH